MSISDALAGHFFFKRAFLDTTELLFQFTIALFCNNYLPNLSTRDRNSVAEYIRQYECAGLIELSVKAINCIYIFIKYTSEFFL